MLTELSKCIDCNFLTVSPKSNSYNKSLKENYEKLEILKIFLPTELAIKIVKMTYTYFKCCYCKLLVCKEHAGIEYEECGVSHLEPIVLCGNCMKLHIGYI